MTLAKAIALPAALLLAAAAAPTSTLTVQVGNVRNAKGRVHLDVCPEGKFLKDGCPYQASATAHAGTTIVIVPNVAPGRYAIQAFHDENMNDHVDRGFLGLPKEGVGFSNDAPIRLGPPSFASAAFTVPGGDQVIRFKLRYFFGPSGPGK